MTAPDDPAAGRLAVALACALPLDADQAAIVVWDGDCALSRLLGRAYARAWPEATSLDFARTANVALLTGFDLLEPRDVVVLIQTRPFDLDLIAVRADLVRRGVRLVEHAELAGREAELGEPCEAALAADRPAGSELLGQLLGDLDSGGP